MHTPVWSSPGHQVDDESPVRTFLVVMTRHSQVCMPPSLAFLMSPAHKNRPGGRRGEVRMPAGHHHHRKQASGLLLAPGIPSLVIVFGRPGQAPFLYRQRDSGVPWYHSFGSQQSPRQASHSAHRKM